MRLFGPPNVEELQSKGNISGLTKALDYKRDLFVRSDAARALGQIGDSRAVEPLVAVLKDKDEYSSLRLDAARALGQIGDTRAVEPLIVALKDQELGKRRSLVARALGQIGDTRAVEPLIAVLEEDHGGSYSGGDGTLLGEGAIALARIGDPRAVEPLITFLKDHNTSAYRRGVVARALGKFGDPCTVEPLIAALREDDEKLGIGASDALVQIGTPAVELLTDVLKDKDAIFVQEFAIRALGRIGDARAVEPLIAVLKDIDSSGKSSACSALAQIGTPAIEPLIAVLKDKDTHTRTRDFVVYALERINEPQAKDALEVFADEQKGHQQDGQSASYKLVKTCLGNPLELDVTTERLCVYCKHLRGPNLRDLDYPKGVGECSNYSSSKSVVSFDDSCELWEPNTKVRFWLSKGYMGHNLEGWPRKPWYQVFDDGPDGEKGTR